MVWPILTGKISRAEWREWARQKREMMQRFNSEKEALVADNKRLRASMDPSVRSVSPNHPSDLHPSSVALCWDSLGAGGIHARCSSSTIDCSVRMPMAVP